MSTIHETAPRTQVHLERAVELAAENAAGDGGPSS